ncbi:MAG: serine hydrolase [Gemmatimonadetes bacterium]|nr:serine hydrolase [Gemmatimonadota bacterium]
MGRDYYNNARILALMSRQRTLNFRPGEEYGYTGLGYIVLAEIVKRVTGTSLREFAEENIFGPLGMANTRYDDNYRTVVKNRVQSYRPGPQGGWRRLLRNTDHVGSGGLLSTAEDLLRWNRNFDDMTVGGPDFIELILTRGTLNNGDTLEYAFGLRLRESRGLKIVRLGGLVGGFLARLVRFPEQGFAVAVLCNSTAIAIGSLTRGVADIYLREEFGAAATADASPPPPAPEAVAVSTSELRKVTGYYWDDTIKLLRRIYVQEDTLRYSRDDRKLVPLGNDRFYRLDAPTEVIVSFTSPTPEQPRQMIEVIADGEPRVYDAVEPVSPSPMELEGYLGTYYSEDADYEWVLRITNDRLSMWDPRTWYEFALRPVVRDVFQAEEYTFTFSRDGQGRVVGFAVDTGRLRNLKFVRR